MAQPSESELGATATEYVLLLALLVLVVAIGITQYGGELETMFDKSVDEVDVATMSN